MKRMIAVVIAFAASGMLATAQPAREHYEPGLGEFMTATQLRHAKLWYAGKQKNWNLAAYEIDEIKEGLADARRLFPAFEGIPVAEMIKTIVDPRIEKLEEAIKTKSSSNFTVAFDELTRGCNQCHAGANRPFIRIQRPTSVPLTNQNFTPGK
jgi:hypothetical protein